MKIKWKSKEQIEQERLEQESEAQEIRERQEKIENSPIRLDEQEGKIQNLKNEYLMSLMALAEVYEHSLGLEEENLLLKQKVIQAEQNTLIAFMGIAQVYEELLVLIGGN